MIPVVKEVHVERVSKFEPKGAWSAIKEWREWETSYQSKVRLGNDAEKTILLAAFIQSKEAATGPLATWNRIHWLRRHLKADISLETIKKPPKREGVDGKVREAEQAVATPPEFLVVFEGILEKMVDAGDWRRGGLAASLQVAYSLIRPVHLGRSAFTHETKVSYWLEAFRLKGKRQGARGSFRWAMVRRGLTGYDVARVLYEIWLEWPTRVGYALDYAAMDPGTGTKLEGSHIQAVMRSVAEAFMPDPTQVSLLQNYSNRRFGGTLVVIVKTPPTDAVAYGGWAGVPELAKMATDASEMLMAWKRSMPHLYSDRRSEEEEIQKFLHVELLRRLIVAIPEEGGRPQPATWEVIESTAMMM